MLLDERFNESEHSPNVEAAISFFFFGDVRIQFADLGSQQRHVINEKMRHALQFYEPIIKIHSRSIHESVQFLVATEPRGQGVATEPGGQGFDEILQTIDNG